VTADSGPLPVGMANPAPLQVRRWYYLFGEPKRCLIRCSRLGENSLWDRWRPRQALFLRLRMVTR
jgi:hypothetical protein